MDGYLRKTHGYINGGELEKLAQVAGYKASNASRRLRVLEEASRGILTTPEHEQAAKILRGSVIEKIEKRGGPAGCQRFGTASMSGRRYRNIGTRSAMA